MNEMPSMQGGRVVLDALHVMQSALDGMNAGKKRMQYAAIFPLANVSHTHNSLRVNEIYESVLLWNEKGGSAIEFSGALRTTVHKENGTMLLFSDHRNPGLNPISLESGFHELI